MDKKVMNGRLEISETNNTFSHPLRDEKDVENFVNFYMKEHVGGPAEIWGLGIKTTKDGWSLLIPKKGIFVFDEKNSLAMRKIGDVGFPLLQLAVNMKDKKPYLLAVGGDFEEQGDGNIGGSGAIIPVETIHHNLPWENYLTKRALKYLTQGIKGNNLTDAHIAKRILELKYTGDDIEMPGVYFNRGGNGNGWVLKILNEPISYGLVGTAGSVHFDLGWKLATLDKNTNEISQGIQEGLSGFVEFHTHLVKGKEQVENDPTLAQMIRKFGPELAFTTYREVDVLSARASKNTNESDDEILRRNGDDEHVIQAAEYGGVIAAIGPNNKVMSVGAVFWQALLNDAKKRGELISVIKDIEELKESHLEELRQPSSSARKSYIALQVKEAELIAGATFLNFKVEDFDRLTLPKTESRSHS